MLTAFVACFSSLLTGQPGAGTLPEPVFIMDLRGTIRMKDERMSPQFRPRASTVSCPGGYAFSFDGVSSGISFGDVRPLRLTKSLSVSCWLRLESYVDRGQGAQIAFRGDDRSVLDPFTLSIRPEGTVEFQIQNEKNETDRVFAPMPLHH